MAHAIPTAMNVARQPKPLTVEEKIEEGEGFAAFEAPQRFQRLVWRALGEELISPVRAAQMLGMPLNIIEREIRGPREH